MIVSRVMRTITIIITKSTRRPKLHCRPSFPVTLDLCISWSNELIFNVTTRGHCGKGGKIDIVAGRTHPVKIKYKSISKEGMFKMILGASVYYVL